MSTRSRIYVAIAVVIGPVIFAARLLGGTLGFIAFVLFWLVGIISFVGLVITVVRLNDLSLRPNRFTLSPKGFHARPAIRPAAMLPWLSAAVGNELGLVLTDQPLGAVRIIADAGLVVILGAMAGFAFRRSGLVLTRDGLLRGVGPLRHEIAAWDELLPEGPLRPHPGDSTMSVTVGSGRRPLPTQLDVHPWFVADAIRWYIAHPEHRAAIGTQAEHERLTAALGRGR